MIPPDGAAKCFSLPYVGEKNRMAVHDITARSKAFGEFENHVSCASHLRPRGQIFAQFVLDLVQEVLRTLQLDPKLSTELVDTAILIRCFQSGRVHGGREG